METTHNYLFVSDLHLSAGCDPKTGRLSRNEDFFHDASFAQFLAYHINLSRRVDVAHYYRKPWRLVINGDIFDFLQVVSLPAEGDELFRVRNVRKHRELSSNEQGYGLGTRATEIVWKLRKIADGHPLFFQALAWFVAHPEHELILLKGNHDVEIYWPEAQRSIRKLLLKAYKTWHQEIITPGPHESPLAFHEGLPPALSEEQLQRTVQFPSSSYHVEGLFYVEHGCQYDPVNSFSNFENPTLPEKPELIELPSGSFFVRYFFNKIEEVHPFADNLRPISRYFNWVIRHAPSAMARFLLEILPRYLVAYAKLQVKKQRDARRQREGKARSPQMEMVQVEGQGQQQPVRKDFEKDVLELQAQTQQRMRRASKVNSLGIVLGILLRLGSLVLFLLALRHFVLANYLWMSIDLVAGVLLAFAGSILSRQLQRVLAPPYLQEAAETICRFLNERGDQGPGSVRYHVFGHNHVAAVKEIGGTADGRQEHRQWYVNTGSWIPVFSEEDRLLRGADQLTFFRLVPDDPDLDERTPELLQWWPAANQPRPIRLFVEEAQGQGH